MKDFIFACPVCQGELLRVSETLMRCTEDRIEFKSEAGIWHFLRPERRTHFEQFIEEYETVRRKEGRGSKGPEFYRALPFQDLTGKFLEDWKIRAKSYTTLIKKVIVPLEQETSPLNILDLGAGNGWLSNRLAGRGHQLAAIDLMLNPLDGLGAHIHFEHAFTPIQAEFQHLPLADWQFDVAIFNASLHYAESYETTLQETRRVLKRDGVLVILDSPVYHDPESGKQMAKEREVYFQKQFGFKSNSIASEHYLTDQRLNVLGKALGLAWESFTPFYGLGWMLKPLRARLRGRREPARFMVIVGRRKS